MSYYVGIDPSSRATGIAAIHEDGALHNAAGVTLHTGTRELPDRLVILRQGIRSILAPISDDGVWCCVIERPGTRFGGASLLAAFGVAVEAARSVLKCPVLTLSSAEWKRLACGNGAAKKQDVMDNARLLGFTGTSQDAADALMCAEAARVLTRQQIKDAA